MPGSAAAATVEDARNFFERKSAEREAVRGEQNEGRFERIVKETSNILGKACSVVKGSLGFEARSDSSDLGLGSESSSDSRRRSMDDGVVDDRPSARATADRSVATKAHEGKKPHTNLTRSRSCVDSIECQDDGQEFDHVRYKIVKSHLFSKNMFNTARGDVTYDGLMQYLREYSFQELLMDNNVVIIEPVRAEPVERKSPIIQMASTCKIAGTIQKKAEDRERSGDRGEQDEQKTGHRATKIPKQSSIRKHFFYQPIRVNREMIDEELPDPDTVKNVRQMFENTLKTKAASSDFSRDCKGRRSVSMKDLTSIDDSLYDEISERAHEESRSRCSSRAKDLKRLFETKSTSSTLSVAKEEAGSQRGASKTRKLAQTFEARSGNTSPSDSNCFKNKVSRYQHHLQNWDSGSVSSGVSSDYPDTDGGSAAHCTSSDDEDANCNGNDGADTSGPGHYVSQDVLNKIRECGTSVTYYGGKVVTTHNGPLISPLIGSGFKRVDRPNDYVKFKLVKSNSCDSRLELTGRLVPGRLSLRNGYGDRGTDLRQYTIAETPSIEITTIERQSDEEQRDRAVEQIGLKKEPPIVVGLELKKEEPRESRTFKADFKLGNLEDSRSDYPSRFTASALTRWEVNASNWKADDDFGKMEFEEYEVLEDSLNGIDAQVSS